ncbi:MAG: hypothetical protein ABW061_17595 [Polyangiaceae bacterium]
MAGFSYFVYGLHIRADFELWPWGATEARGDSTDEVVVGLSPSNRTFPALGFGPGRREAVLEWPGVGAFWIAEGKSIVVRPAVGVTTEELALVTAGSVLALLLEQRGHTVLHGSCIELRGEGIALLGPSGSGKSTLAATLRGRGHALISDGMTVVDPSGTQPLVLPGPPHFKLWPDAIASLGESQAASRPVARQEIKRWYEATDQVALRPVPIRRLFLLQPGAGVVSERLSPAAGLMGLVKNYFLADFADAPAREFILERCAPLARAASVSTLQRGTELSDLAAVIAELGA